MRAALLVLAAVSACVIAWAGALDLRLLSGARSSAALTAGSYVMVLLFAVALVVLVGGVARAMLRGARAESARVLTPLEIDALQQPAIVLAPSDAGDKVAASVTPLPTPSGPPAADPEASVSFAVNPVRSASKRTAGRRGRSRPRPPSLDPSLADAAAALSNDSVSSSGLISACEDVVASLRRLPSDSARAAASAALLPGLVGRLQGMLRDGVAAETPSVAACCHAMAALSDYADAATLSLLATGDAPAQLVELLRQLCPHLQEGATPLVVPPPALSDALWSLGNLVAAEGASRAFTNAGGAELLVALLSSATAATQHLGPARRGWSDAALHACVALATLSAHAQAADALVDAGVLPALARTLHPEGAGSPPETRVTHATPAATGLGSLAVAEAASHALANVLRRCATGGQARLGDASRVCSELASRGAIAGCTALLLQRQAPEPLADAAAPPEDADACTAYAAEALTCIVTCAVAAQGSSAAAALAREAEAAGSEAAARRRALEVADGQGSAVRDSLGALADALRSWLALQSRGAAALDVHESSL